MAHDVIVVGGGTAGCVMASRLSENPDRDVLLVEAGPDYPGVADLPPDIADGSGPTFSHDWGFAAEPVEGGRGTRLPRGRLIGGCSATNAAFLFRGWPADYDAWAAMGNGGWSFAEVLGTIRAIEADADFADEWHGRSGPVPVTRPVPADLAELQMAFLDTAVSAGHARVDDHNRPGAVGVGPAPRNVREGRRMSTALTHLAPARGRANLTVRAGTLVDRIELSGSRATGVRLAGGEILAADRVVLTAGSYAGPAILLRSGIGPAADLRALGLPMVADLPGVGANLIDHPLVAVDLPAATGSSGPRFQVMLSMRTSRAGADDPPDLHLFPAGPFEVPNSPSGAVFGIVTGLLSVRSRGSVRLRSRDPLDPPWIDIAHLRDPEDLDRMIEATLHARRLSRMPPLADLVLGPELAPGAAIGDDDRAGLARSIRDRVDTYHHPVGTCAMGPDPARGAVVDPRGAVHGIANLWVADASVMPSIPAANTNLSTILVAERIAAWLAGD